MKLSLIVPVYKSANTLAELHERIGLMIERQTYGCEVIYVNDASPDHSLEVLRSLPPVPVHRIVSLKTNQGQSTALLSGMMYAQGDFVGTLDADLQDDPEHFPRLLNDFEENTEVVFAGRAGHYESKRRLLASLLFKTLVHLVSGRSVPVDAGLFLVVRRDTAQRLVQYLPESPYLIGLIAKLRLPCRSAPIVRQANHLGETSYTMGKRLKVSRQFFSTLLAKPVASSQALSCWTDKHISPPIN